MIRHNMRFKITKKSALCFLAMLLLFSFVPGCGNVSGIEDAAEAAEVTDELSSFADQAGNESNGLSDDQETAVPSPTKNPYPSPDATDDHGYIPVPPKIIDPSLMGSSDDESAYSGPDVPLQLEADDEFFSDAVFIGNSLMDGFRLFSGLETCTYYAVTSMTVVGIDSSMSITLDNGYAGTIMQGLAQRPFDKIYIELGVNEIGYDTAYFKELYGNMLDDMRELQPDADIYIMSLTPISQHRSSTDSTFNMNRVNAYNEVLYQLAEEKECLYLNLCEALGDESGYLPSNVTSDGIHFSADHYKVWLNYVKTHYV